MSNRSFRIFLCLVSGLMAADSCLAEPPRGAVTYLGQFNGKNGDSPQSNLIFASDGNYYGTTAESGKNGYGTVYRMTPDGTIKDIYSFNFQSPEGSAPQAQLIQGSDGLLYGTTLSGGKGYGTVFKISLAGKLTTLQAFNGESGYWPASALVQGPDGTVYGTTEYGGTTNDGIVYSISSAGLFSVLAEFKASLNASRPIGNILLGSDGTIYGVTNAGGANNVGILYSLSPSGTISDLYDFSTTPNAGLTFSAAQDKIFGTTGDEIFQFSSGVFSALANTGDSVGQLTLGPDGATLYGFKGGDVVISCTQDGIVTSLANFRGYVARTEGPLVTSTGSILGVTSDSGKKNMGEVFEATGF